MVVNSVESKLKRRNTARQNRKQKAKSLHIVTTSVSANCKPSSLGMHILGFTTDVYKSGYGTLTSVDRFLRQASPYVITRCVANHHEED